MYNQNCDTNELAVVRGSLIHEMRGIAVPSLVAAIALSVIIGWVLDLPILTSWISGGSTQKPAAALSFLALVLALQAVDTGRAKFAAGLCLAVGSIALASLLQNLLEFDLGLDAWLASSLAEPGGGSSNWRMSVPSALMFMASGSAIAALSSRHAGWLVPLLTAVMVLVVVLVLAAVVSAQYAGVNSPAVSLPALAAFLLLTFELLRRQPWDLAAVARRAGWRIGIRGWLLLLAASLAVPLLLFAFILLQSASDFAERMTRGDLERETAAAAQSVERFLTSAANVASALTLVPVAQRGDWAAFHVFARNAVKNGMAGAGVLVATPGGRQLLNSRKAFGAALPIYDPPGVLNHILETTTPYISDLYFGPVAQKQVFTATAPLVRDGRLAAVLAIAFEPEHIAALLKEQHLPDQWIASVVDRQGIIVARTIAMADWLGKKAPIHLLESRLHAPQGQYTGATIEGVEALVHFKNLPNGWTVVVDVPSRILNAPATRAAWLMTVMGLLSLFIAGFLALIIARHMSKQMFQVANAARDIGCGRAPASAATAISELDQISQALVDSHDALRAHDMQLEASRDSFRHLVEKSPFGVYAADADFRLVLVSDGAQETFKNVRPLIGRELGEALRIVWAEPFASEAIEHFRHTLATGEPYHATNTIELRRDIERVDAYDWKVERVMMPDGRYGVVCHFYDLSERQRYEAALLQSEERLRLSLSASNAGAWSWMLERDEIDCSPETYALHGIDSAKGGSYSAWMEVIHPDDRTAVMEAARKTLDGEVPEYHVEYRVILADGTIRWLLGVGNVERDEAGKAVKLGGINLDITQRKQSEEHTKFLTEEVNHRSKNLLAVVQAMARQSAKKTRPAEFVDALTERLSSLSVNQSLLVESLWQGVEMRDLVRSQLAHFENFTGERITFEGPPISLNPRASQTIGMVIHELATNAAKYGALSNTDGKVGIKWVIRGNVLDGVFQLSWIESDGPRCVPPKRKGFGHTVIVEMAEQALQGEITLLYMESGLQWHMIAPLKNLLRGQHTDIS